MRRYRTTILVAVGVVVLLLAITWLQGDGSERDGELDPRNPGPAGAQAVARVLADHDVDVSITRGQRAFLDAAVDPSTAVVVSNADALGASTLRRLREHAAVAGTVVLVGSSATLLRAYDLEIATPVSGTVRAGCSEPLLRDLRIRVRSAFSLRGQGCFREQDGALVVRPDRSTWLVGTTDPFRNDSVLDADNAAVALRLLGQRSRVVWYVADPADTVAADAVSVRTFLPPWLIPGLWLLAIAALAFVLWRGRRLGPLVREPIPVVVRAVESTESRGRLYRRTRDRAYAARILRAATRRTLADRLALRDDSPETLARALPAHRDLVVDGDVRDDAALADLARDLTRLEDEVDRT